MGLITNLLEKNYASYLHEYLETHKIKRSSVTWDESKSIGILFDGLNVAANPEILDFIKKSKKQGLNVKALAIVNKKLDTSSLIFDTISSKDISWSQVPKLDALNNFHTTPFDILFNFYNSGIKPLEFISMISNAKMRIGFQGTNIDCSDLLVGNAQHSSFIDLVESSKKILRHMAVGA